MIVPKIDKIQREKKNDKSLNYPQNVPLLNKINWNWIILTKDQSSCEKKLSTQLIFEIEKVLFSKLV